MQLLCIIAPVFYKCKRNLRKVKNFGFSAFFRLNDEKTGDYSAKKVNFKERQRENPPVGADRGIARKRKKGSQIEPPAHLFPQGRYTPNHP